VNNCSQSFVDDLEEEGHKCAAGLLLQNLQCNGHLHVLISNFCSVSLEI